jgi:hypothetical protein
MVGPQPSPAPPCSQARYNYIIPEQAQFGLLHLLRRRRAGSSPRPHPVPRPVPRAPCHSSPPHQPARACSRAG